MCPSPSKENDSFTLNDLMKKINYLVPNIDDFLGDIGSGHTEWIRVRKQLIMTAKFIQNLDPDTKITEENLVKQYNELKLDKLLSMKIEDFREKLDKVTTPSKEKQIRFSISPTENTFDSSIEHKGKRDTPSKKKK